MRNRCFLSAIVIILTYSFVPLNENYDCYKFKKGVFRYEGAPLVGKTKVIRNDYEQIEWINDSTKLNLTIVWKSNCEFLLIPKEKIDSNFSTKDTMFVTITKILSDSSYAFKSKIGNVITYSKMVKISDL
jgi:hypothetical protein